MRSFNKLFHKSVIIGSGSIAAGVFLFTKANLKPDESKKVHDTHYDTDPTIRYTHRQQWDDNWDFRIEQSQKSETHKPNILKQTEELPASEPSLPVEKSTPKRKKGRRPSRNIILIRHGQYDQSSELDSERKLTALGRIQAKLTGERLNNWLTNVDSLHVSTMSRALETCELIVNEMDVLPNKETCEMLREGAPHPPDPLSASWQPERWQFFIDGPRIEAAFRKFFHRPSPEQKEDTYELIICHANVIRYFVCRALQFPREGWLRMSLGNCSVTWVNIRANGRVSLRSLGDVGHLHPNEITFN